MRKDLRACLLAWLVPGGGHWYLGKRTAAVTLFAALMVLYGMGIFLRGGVLIMSKDVISCVSFVMRIGAGLPWLVGLICPWRHPDVLAPFSEVGSAYTGIAGALNFLSIFAVFDLAKKQS